MMLRTVLRLQRQLAQTSSGAFCNATSKPPGSGNGSSDKPSKEGGEGSTLNASSAKPTGSISGGFMPRQNREWKKNSSATTTVGQQGSANASSNTVGGAANASAQSQQGSRITPGSSEEIKQSIAKSLSEVSAQYKLSFKESKQKVGVKLTIEEKPVESLSTRRQRLLGQLSETKEELKTKWVSSMPVAQQILVDRLKQYGLRASDAKRMRDTLKEEEGVDFSYVEPRNLELLNSHIHRSAEEMETFISTYIGADTPLTKSEELDEWRQQQAINHIDVIKQSCTRTRTHTF